MLGAISKPVVDELRTGLELATQDELASLAEVLFRPKFNPLDYWCTPSPQRVLECDLNQRIQQIEARIRFLAADGLTVLKQDTHQLSYRRILLQLGHHFKLKLPTQLSTLDLEAEIFLQLLEKTWQKLSPAEQQQLEQRLTSELAQVQQFQALSPELKRHPIALILKGSSALAINSVVRPWLLHNITQQFVIQLTRHQVAQQALKGAVTLGAKNQGRAALNLASTNLFNILGKGLGLVLRAAHRLVTHGPLLVLPCNHVRRAVLHHLNDWVLYWCDVTTTVEQRLS